MFPNIVDKNDEIIFESSPTIKWSVHTAIINGTPNLGIMKLAQRYSGNGDFIPIPTKKIYIPISIVQQICEQFIDTNSKLNK